MTKTETYYSQKPMRVYNSSISNFFNKFVKNFSREEVAAEINLHGDACLDVACGDGELINKFLYKNYVRAEGIDISKKLIETARSIKKKNCIFYIGDIEEIVDDFLKKGKKYNDLYLLAILEHIQWPSIFVRRIYKLLDRGGRVVVEVPNVSWLPHRISLLLGRFPITAPTVGVIPGVYDEHIRFFTIDTLDMIFQQAGLRRIKLDCSGKLRMIKKLHPKLLSPDIVAVYEKV